MYKILATKVLTSLVMSASKTAEVCVTFRAGQAFEDEVAEEEILLRAPPGVQGAHRARREDVQLLPQSEAEGVLAHGCGGRAEA